MRSNNAFNVLYYCEPHPFRNSFTEHAHIATLLMPPLARFARQRRIGLRLFSNNAVIDRLLTEMPEHAVHYQRPTDAETADMEAFFGRWTAESIETWLQLVRGDGDITEVYLAMLERLHAEQKIDAVLAWSDNGALRRFGDRHGVVVLFGERGPTRAPFPPTLYFDPAGTNGRASFRPLLRRQLEAQAKLPGAYPPAQTWLLTSEAGLSRPFEEIGLLDKGATWDPATVPLLPDKPYVYIPLQLADDLNTLSHSAFSKPKDFLHRALALAQEGGYAAVVKGHPGAPDRIYNLRHELEALEDLEETYPEAIVLPRRAGSIVSTVAMANAAYTISNNSSVSFESMMLGVPGLALGDAVYDAGGWLQANVVLQPAGAGRGPAWAMDALVSAHMEQVFVPEPVVADSDYLFLRLEALLQGKDLTLMEGGHFALWHVTDGTEGVGVPVPPLAEPKPLPALSEAEPFIGAGDIVPGMTVRLRGETVLFDAENGVPPKWLRLGGACIGHLDVIVIDPQTKDQRLVGWVFDTERQTPPLMVAVLARDKLFAIAAPSEVRMDVGRHLGLKAHPMCGIRIPVPEEGLGETRLILITHEGLGTLIEPVAPRSPIGRRA